MSDVVGRIFLHGLESSGHGFKAKLLRSIFPAMLTPDFHGALEERMEQLAPIMAERPAWIIVGSSFGGLMGALFACQHPQQVRKLVLLAPALTRPQFADDPPAPVAVPVVAYHGRGDTVIPLEPTRALAERVFSNLTFHVVDDNHMLRTTVQSIDWQTLLRAV
jgi:pimeloyl-ACP methyl ester carboxylesterase